MPTNIQVIERTNELPYGTLQMYQVNSETDAAYYANGRTAYLYRSKIIEAMYLFVPVL